ncbi:chorismate mutase [Methylovirgula sp. 4M-Z18]|uniref:chorismate mutase n=1 Tax=Methylovirgula sp. 4M-Z18 TaxID=2293567 RepID=UPI00403F2B72
MMSAAPDTKLDTLADLRVEIDRIDRDMHELLMERGEIIDRLIAVKARQGGGSAFRPGREASMMQMIAERHHGALPLDTVEGIWRIIISTFTYVQANYSVHADFSGGDAAMRDSVRFHFGFTVPCVVHHGAGGVIDAVARASGDLGMFRVDGGAAAGAWWKRLVPEGAPKIIARLPFVERPDHPAGMPIFVISVPLNEAAAHDVMLYAVAIDHWSGAIPELLGQLGGEVLGNVADGKAVSLLVSLPGTVDLETMLGALHKSGVTGLQAYPIGSHAARYEFTGRHSEAT